MGVAHSEAQISKKEMEEFEMQVDEEYNPDGIKTHQMHYIEYLQR